MKNPTRGLQTIFCFAVAAPLVLLLLVPVSAQRRLTRPGTWEGEHLVNSGKVTAKGGSVATQRMSGFGPGWSGDSQLFWGGGQVGAVLDLTIDIGEEGIYEVELHMTRAPDFGRLRIQVDGKDAADVFDGYAPTVVPSGPVKIGSFDLQPGPRNIRFTIEGRNPNSSNYFAGIDFVRLHKIPVAASQTSQTQSSLEPTPKWSITALSFLTSPTETGLDGKKASAYKEGQVITVKCSYEPIVAGEARLRIRDYWPGNQWQWVRHDAAVTKAGTQTVSFAVSGSGTHFVKCGVAVWSEAGFDTQDPYWSYLDDGSLPFQVVAGTVPSQTKWPTAPMIEESGVGGKLVIKPRNAASSHCGDGGFISFEWQYLDKGFKTYEPSTWKPLKMMTKPFKCVPEGSIKDMSGLKPGQYRVRAQEFNGKYSFTSEWSDWVEFQIANK